MALSYWNPTLTFPGKEFCRNSGPDGSTTFRVDSCQGIPVAKRMTQRPGFIHRQDAISLTQRFMDRSLPCMLRDRYLPAYFHYPFEFHAETTSRRLANGWDELSQTLRWTDGRFKEFTLSIHMHPIPAPTGSLHEKFGLPWYRSLIRCSQSDDFSFPNSLMHLLHVPYLHGVPKQNGVARIARDILHVPEHAPLSGETLEIMMTHEALRSDLPHLPAYKVRESV